MGQNNEDIMSIQYDQYVTIPLPCGLGLVSVLGVLCAKPIMLSMRKETFVKLELLVVVFAGLRLMWLGLTMY